MKTKHYTDFFDSKELIGQNLFNLLRTRKPEINPAVFTPRGSAEDVKMLSGETYFLAEIKVRQDFTIRQMLLQKPFCEFMKWDSIRRKKLKYERESGCKIELLYINFLRDGVCIYKLGDIKQAKFFWEWLPESNEDKTPIEKYVTLLDNPLEVIKMDFPLQ
jgi:hypothetical protein